MTSDEFNAALYRERCRREAVENENRRLRAAIQQTLDENGHLADGENCTLIVLKRALKTPNVQADRREPIGEASNERSECGRAAG